MNSPSNSIQSSVAHGTGSERWQAENAFTLVEVLVASSVFALVMGSVVVMFVYASRVASGVTQQLVYGSQSRVLNVMARDIKAATQVTVQTYNGSTFSNIAAGSPQQGNALSLTVPVSTVTNQVIYWLKFTGTPTGTLYRATVNASYGEMVVNNVTNSLPFALTSYSGSVLSNQAQRTLINIDLYVFDPNPKNFRQTMLLHSAVEKRN